MCQSKKWALRHTVMDGCKLILATWDSERVLNLARTGVSCASCQPDT